MNICFFLRRQNLELRLNKLEKRDSGVQKWEESQKMIKQIEERNTKEKQILEMKIKDLEEKLHSLSDSAKSFAEDRINEEKGQIEDLIKDQVNSAFENLKTLINERIRDRSSNVMDSIMITPIITEKREDDYPMKFRTEEANFDNDEIAEINEENVQLTDPEEMEARRSLRNSKINDKNSQRSNNEIVIVEHRSSKAEDDNIRYLNDSKQRALDQSHDTYDDWNASQKDKSKFGNKEAKLMKSFEKDETYEDFKSRNSGYKLSAIKKQDDSILNYLDSETNRDKSIYDEVVKEDMSGLDKSGLDKTGNRSALNKSKNESLYSADDWGTSRDLTISNIDGKDDKLRAIGDYIEEVKEESSKKTDSNRKEDSEEGIISGNMNIDDDSIEEIVSGGRKKDDDSIEEIVSGGRKKDDKKVEKTNMMEKKEEEGGFMKVIKANEGNEDDFEIGDKIDDLEIDDFDDF